MRRLHASVVGNATMTFATALKASAASYKEGNGIWVLGVGMNKHACHSACPKV